MLTSNFCPWCSSKNLVISWALMCKLPESFLWIQGTIPFVSWSTIQRLSSSRLIESSGGAPVLSSEICREINVPIELPGWLKNRTKRLNKCQSTCILSGTSSSLIRSSFNVMWFSERTRGSNSSSSLVSLYSQSSRVCLREWSSSTTSPNNSWASCNAQDDIPASSSSLGFFFFRLC